MNRSAFLAAIGAALLSSTIPALAEGGWSGFYVGLEAGGGNNTVNLQDNVFFPVDEDQSDSGIVAGVFAGYDHQIGDFVIGGVADIDYVGTSDIVFEGKGNTNYDMNWVATARVRAGWAPSDQLLFYGTGGFAVAGQDGNVGTFAGPLPIKSTQWGYVIGAGAEYRFASNWSVKGEYLHHDFGTVEVDGSSAIFTPKLDVFRSVWLTGSDPSRRLRSQR